MGLPHENDWQLSDAMALDPGTLAWWAVDWRSMHPVQRWLHFERLWIDACMLRERYLLPLRSGWWRNEISVEALAALAAWVAGFDEGALDDPAGKLALLFDLQRVGELLREGLDPFVPARDRDGFILYMLEVGCEPPKRDPRGPASDGYAAGEPSATQVDWQSGAAAAECPGWPVNASTPPSRGQVGGAPPAGAPPAGAPMTAATPADPCANTAGAGAGTSFSYQCFYTRQEWYGEHELEW